MQLESLLINVPVVSYGSRTLCSMASDSADEIVCSYSLPGAFIIEPVQSCGHDSADAMRPLVLVVECSNPLVIHTFDVASSKSFS